MIAHFCAALLTAAWLYWIWRAYRWQRLAIRRRPHPPALERYPSLSVVRPIKGLDTGIEENIRAALDHGYPGKVETLFVFDDAREPALPLVEKALAERKRAGQAVDARIILCGPPPARRTGKLNAMIAGFREAHNELIAFVDSDVRQDREALKILVETLFASDRAGVAFAPVVATEPPMTVGDVGYALMINGLYEPAAIATADRFGGELPFVMGEFMVFKREAIAAIGGLESAEGQLVDDMFLGRRLNELGYRNRMSPHPVAIVQQGASIGEFLPVLVRWIAFSRSGLPARSFKLHHWLIGAAFWTGLILALAALATGNLLSALLAGLVPLSVALMMNDLHHRIGGARLPARYSWVALGLWLAAPLIYTRVFTAREVEWRGRRYRLDTEARLAVESHGGRTGR
jgi:ceramide glucosyltransferase